MATSITVHLQIFKHTQLLHFSTDLDETGIKTHGLLRSLTYNIVIIRVAVPFNIFSIYAKNFCGAEKCQFLDISRSVKSPSML